MKQVRRQARDVLSVMAFDISADEYTWLSFSVISPFPHLNLHQSALLGGLVRPSSIVSAAHKLLVKLCKPQRAVLGLGSSLAGWRVNTPSQNSETEMVHFWLVSGALRFNGPE